MGALDVIIRTLDIKSIYAHDYYWGAYRNMLLVHNKPLNNYSDFEWLRANVEEVAGSAVIICDPNNPLGTKYDDESLLELVRFFTANGVTVIWDGPYRRLFNDASDDMYVKLAQIEDVIICESFSKSVGLSGQRIGFIYCANPDFGKELTLNVLYAGNGVNAFGQQLITLLLSSPEGQKAVADFKKTTVEGIAQNIAYLYEIGLLADKYYQTAEPVGIFVVVNRSHEELLENRIGSDPLGFFTAKKEEAEGYARICVSVPHEKFKQFFQVFA
jgi:aspartate/methionine/tyrosine aminotransferase